jgi:phosphatidylserine/phosphatidylglycerophosphate/cardiolipin synthase-like enzyme
VNDEAVAFVVDLAENLPKHDLEQMAKAAQDGINALIGLRSRSGSPAVRDACGVLVNVLNHGASPAWLCGTLQGAGVAAANVTAAQSLEVVWTGPESEVDTTRLTAPAVVGLISEATRELLVVSFATYEEPRISEALKGAVERGVDVTIVLERPQDNPSFTGVAEAFPTLRARRLAWPARSRVLGAALHAKILVVDDAAALVSSANLTGRGIEDNLECGVLIRGGTQPAAIRAHIWSLWRRGTLEVVFLGRH